jgi:anti-sigma factor RsiW
MVGGRLDHVENREVAALIYRRRKHFINAFVWSNPSGSESTQAIGSRQGYSITRWTHDGFQFWAVSDVASSDLAEFVRLLETRTPPVSK